MLRHVPGPRARASDSHFASVWLTFFYMQECVFCDKGVLKCDACQGSGYEPAKRPKHCKTIPPAPMHTQTAQE